MAMLLIEGFEKQDTLSDFYRGIATGITYNTSTVRSVGGTSLRLASSYGEAIFDLPSASDVLYVGFAVYLTDSTPTLEYTFLTFYDGTTAQCTVRITAAAAIAVYRSTTKLGESATGVVSDATWHYIEIKMTIANTLGAGGIEIKVDGTSVLTINSGDSQAGSVAQCTAIGITGHTNVIPYIDDLCVFDDAGSLNNSWPGQPYVKTLSPTGNGNTNNFVGADSDSTDNYLQVDDSASDDDTTYVESGTINDIDQYNFPDMPAGTVHGVAVAMMLRNALQGDSVKAKPSIRSNSTDYLGSEFYVGYSYMGVQQVIETDPATSSQWLKAGVDAANFGLKITG